MKAIFYIIFALLIAGCATTKKTSVAADVSTSATIASDKTITSNISNFVDTTKITDAEIVYTKVEFYAPVADAPALPARDENLPSDTIFVLKKPPAAGAVKSVETLNIKINNEEKGVSQTQATTIDSVKQNVVFVESQKFTETTEQKAKYWLKYLMWIAICATIITAIIYAYKFFDKIKE
jgi:predicted membrane protein